MYIGSPALNAGCSMLSDSGNSFTRIRKHQLVDRRFGFQPVIMQRTFAALLDFQDFFHNSSSSLIHTSLPQPFGTVRAGCRTPLDIFILSGLKERSIDPNRP